MRPAAKSVSDGIPIGAHETVNDFGRMGYCGPCPAHGRPHRAALLKNHGVVAVGASIEEAVITVIMLENAAKIQLITAAAGDPGPEFPPADIAKLKQETSEPDQFVINFNYLVRRVNRRDK